MQSRPPWDTNRETDLLGPCELFHPGDIDGEILVATTSSVGDTEYERDERILDRMVTEELTVTP